MPFFAYFFGQTKKYEKNFINTESKAQKICYLSFRFFKIMAIKIAN